MKYSGSFRDAVDAQVQILHQSYVHATIIKSISYHTNLTLLIPNSIVLKMTMKYSGSFIDAVDELFHHTWEPLSMRMHVSMVSFFQDL